MDECPSAQYNPAEAHLTPDTLQGGVHVINDEPTPNLPDGTPLVRTFQDVLMCGTQQVMGAFTWTRTGGTSPQWCAMPGTGQLKTLSGRYSDLRQADPRTLGNVVCNIANSPGYNDQGLWAIQNNTGGCPPKP